MKNKTFVGVIAISILANGLFATSMHADDYTNLQVLPKDISRNDLGQIMVENLRSLGLPRLAGEGCLYCHVGDIEVPRSQWDFASDENPMKDKTRAMMTMVDSINDDHISRLPSKIDSSSEVTCATCHSGRTDPRPLFSVLWDTYEIDGGGAAAESYRELRARYFGAGAYNFKSRVLLDIATKIADQGSMVDAIAMAELNLEFNPDFVPASQAVIALNLERIIGASGVERALEELTKMEPTLKAGVMNPGLLDSLAWRLNRSNREEQGRALLEANYAKYPNEYTAIESYSFILANSGDKEQAFAILEQWLEDNPDHARARRMLTNLRSR